MFLHRTLYIFFFLSNKHIDALDASNYKQAIQLADKALKKNDDTLAAKVILIVLFYIIF